MQAINLNAPLETLFTSNGVNMLNSSEKVPYTDSAMQVKDTGFPVDDLDSIDSIVRSNAVGQNGSFNMMNMNNTYAGFYWDFWQPYNNYYHSCYHTHTSPDKFETAFKLSRSLMNKKLVKPMKTIEDFFKLMDAIVAGL